MSVLVKHLYPNAITPKRETPGSSCYDVFCHNIKQIYTKDNLCIKITGKEPIEWAGISFDPVKFEEGELFTLSAHCRVLVGTVISVAVPLGREIQVRPRSGLALKSGISILNSPGTVDSDYRGEVGLILINTSGVDFTFKFGDRLAQLAECPVVLEDFIVTEKDLPTTQRGEGGFGHTGRN